MAQINDVSPDGIARIALRCKQVFGDIEDAYTMKTTVIGRVYRLLKTSNGALPAMTLDDLIDEFEQFRVWTRNLGVFAADQACLDYRLRDAADVKSGIVSLLNGLENDLDAVLYLLHGDREMEARGDGSSGEIDSDSDDSLPEDNFGRSIYELQARLKRVTDTINKLMQIAEVIRASNPGARMSKAIAYVHYENGVNITEQFEKEYLPALLEHRYKVKTSLLERLVRAISLRRRKFQYQIKHQQRLAYLGDHDLGPSRPVNQMSNRHFLPIGVPAYPDEVKQPQITPVTAPSSNVLTVATTFKKLTVKKTAPSTIVSASTKSTSGNPDIPPPPHVPPRATHFQCPYCCILMPLRKFLVGRGTFSRPLWAKHVIADLQPFVCLEDTCQTPHELLESHEDWVNHQKWEHAMEWWCEGGDAAYEPLNFHTADEYIAHTQSVHQVSLEAANKQASVAGRPSMLPFNACPFCDFNPNDGAAVNKKVGHDVEQTLSTSLSAQTMLQKHISDELLNFFLIALPDRDDIKDIQTDTGRPAAQGSTIKMLDDISVLFPDVDDSIEPLPDTARFPLGFELSIDPYTEKTEGHPVLDWEDVWTSPQLEECVRSTYQGFENDDRLQEMLAASNRDQDGEEADELPLSIPYLMTEHEVLVRGRELPPEVRNYHEILPGYPFDSPITSAEPHSKEKDDDDHGNDIEAIQNAADRFDSDLVNSISRDMDLGLMVEEGDDEHDDQVERGRNSQRADGTIPQQGRIKSSVPRNRRLMRTKDGKTDYAEFFVPAELLSRRRAHDEIID